MTMITPSYLGETIEYSSLHACRSTLEDPTEKHLRANIAKLVAFSAAVEKNCSVSGRVLWSESEENLAQKLIAKLQQTQ